MQLRYILCKIIHERSCNGILFLILQTSNFINLQVFINYAPRSYSYSASGNPANRFRITYKGCSIEICHTTVKLRGNFSRETNYIHVQCGMLTTNGENFKSISQTAGAYKPSAQHTVGSGL